MTQKFYDNAQSIPELIQLQLNQCRNPKLLNYRLLNQWEAISTEGFAESVRRLATGLHSIGIKKGDSIGIIARSSPQWLMIDLAIMLNGAVSVPMFPNISSENFDFQRKDAEIKHLFIESDELLDSPIRSHLSNFSKVISWSVHTRGDNVMFYEELMRLGDDFSLTSPKFYNSMLGNISPDDPATMIYTSGSTGVPKGVVITHKNILTQIRGAKKRYPLEAGNDVALSCLPLAHVFERMVIYYYLSTGLSLYFADDIKKVGDLLRDVKPTVITFVPRILEKVFNKIQDKGREEKGFKKTIVNAAIRYAMKTEPDNHGMMYSLYNKLVFSKFREALGGRMKMCIVGGAAMNPDLARFYLNIGVELFEGYGMTEASPVISANYPGQNKYGTVGPIFPEVEVKLSDKGEIWARGANLMKGYKNNPQETARVIDADGWLHTGDKGTFVEHKGVQHLKITGRLKELFKTSNGKFVSPVPIEQAFVVELPFLEFAMVVAENKHFPSILLFLDNENLELSKQRMNLETIDDKDFATHPNVLAAIAEAVPKINSNLNHWEQIRKYEFITERISVETGELTPKMNLRRHKVEERFTKLINQIYQA